MDQYYIAARWSARKEDVDACAGRTMRFLTSLAQIDSLFSRWAMSTSALDPPPEMEVSARNIRTAFLEEKASADNAYEERGEPIFDNMGYSLYLWNCELGDESLHFSITCGDYGPLEWPNRCDIRALVPVGGHCRVLEVRQLTRVLTHMVSVWNPELAIVSSSGYKRLYPGLSSGLEAGWLTYVPEEYRGSLVGILPPDVSRIDIADGGLILIAVEDVFDVAQDEHVARVQMIQSALDRIAK